MANLRLLPLLASATEIVHALGLGEYQVGRSHECDYPPSVASLPVCTRPAIPVNGSSAEIDSSVKRSIAGALSIYEVDAKLIAALRPTHILTQTQCEVCAVSLRDVERALQEQTSTDAVVVSLSPNRLSDVWRDILHVANACAAAAAGAKLVGELEARIAGISVRAHSAPVRPSVAAIEWLEPLMAAGNWVPELIEMAGGTNLFGTAGQHSPWMTWEALLAVDPDVIVALPCGFDLARTRNEMHWITDRPEWASLSAVRNGRVYLCDGNHYMNRSGPRLVDSARIFAEVFHASLFPPSLHQIGWEHF